MWLAHHITPDRQGAFDASTFQPARGAPNNGVSQESLSTPRLAILSSIGKSFTGCKLISRISCIQPLPRAAADTERARIGTQGRINPIFHVRGVDTRHNMHLLSGHRSSLMAQHEFKGRPSGTLHNQSIHTLKCLHSFGWSMSFSMTPHHPRSRRETWYYLQVPC